MNDGPKYHIARDQTGILIEGDNNVVLQITNHGDSGSRVSDYPGNRPVPVRRTTISLLPLGTGRVIGRDRELAELRSAVDSGGPIQLFGSAGIGKSTLLRHAARQLESGPDGVVFLNARDRDVSEIAQEIFRACYDASGYVPSAVELQQCLQGLRLRVYLDDLVCSAGDLKQLMDILQSSAVVFTARERIPPAATVRAISIGGLDESAAVNLLDRYVSRSLTDDERTVALALLAALDSSPRDLQRIAAAGQRKLPEQKQLPKLLATLVEQQTPEARAVLHLVVSVGGGEISSDHLDAVLRRSDSESVCSALVDAGLLTESEAGYRTPEDVKTEVRRIRPVAARVDVLCRHFTAWAADPATSPDAVANHHRVLDTLVVRAEQEGRPDLGVALARAAAPKLQASLRFGAWGTLLGAGWSAAEKAKDKKAKAYFLHEEGIRCLLTHKLTLAALLFTEAVVLWQELGILAQAHVAQESARLAASQSITGGGTHTGIGAAGAHSTGHAAAGGSAHAHMANAAVHAHAHLAGTAVQAMHTGSSALASNAVPLGTAVPTTAVHGAAVVGHGGTAGNIAPILPTPHTPLVAAPVHAAPVVKPVWQVPGSQTSTTSVGNGTAHGPAFGSHGSAIGSHGAKVGGHLTKPVFHPGGISGVASHGAASGAMTGATGAAGAGGTAAGGTAAGWLGATKALVGLMVCATVVGGVAIVHAEQSSQSNSSSSPSVPAPDSYSAPAYSYSPPVYTYSSPPDPTTYSPDSAPTVDPVCIKEIPAINIYLGSVDDGQNDLQSAVSTYNSTVNDGLQGDWGPVRNTGDNLISRLNNLRQAVDSASSQASDPTLVSAFADEGSAIGTWIQNTQAFVNQSTDSFQNSPSSFNDAVSRVNQVCA